MSDIRAANAAVQTAIAGRVAAGMSDVHANLRKMTEWKPEIGFPQNFKGRSPYGDTMKELNDCPFFSETYLYNLLGKEDARTLLAYMGEFARALGYDGLWEMQERDDDESS